MSRLFFSFYSDVIQPPVKLNMRKMHNSREQYCFIRYQLLIQIQNNLAQSSGKIRARLGWNQSDNSALQTNAV